RVHAICEEYRAAATLDHEHDLQDRAAERPHPRAVAFVCVVFLLHVRSALVAIITLPLGVLIAYLCMHPFGLSSNIMSLGGIAIAIGLGRKKGAVRPRAADHFEVERRAALLKLKRKSPDYCLLSGPPLSCCACARTLWYPSPD